MKSSSYLLIYMTGGKKKSSVSCFIFFFFLFISHGAALQSRRDLLCQPICQDEWSCRRSLAELRCRHKTTRCSSRHVAANRDESNSSSCVGALEKSCRFFFSFPLVYSVLWHAHTYTRGHTHTHHPSFHPSVSNCLNLTHGFFVPGHKKTVKLRHPGSITIFPAYMVFIAVFRGLINTEQSIGGGGSPAETRKSHSRKQMTD